MIHKKRKSWEITLTNEFTVSDQDIRNGAFSLNAGTIKGWLINAKDGVHPHVDQPAEIEKISPLFDGTVNDFVQKFTGGNGVLAQMKNKVRKCKCGKPNAFTLSTCNSCGADLTQTEISFTNNIFSGFLYGIAKGPFPFRISLRYQAEDIMVFDDLLSLCPLHLNTIPTTQYIPDWRWLLTVPKKGLTLINKLFDQCWEVSKTQFLSNSLWCNKILKTEKVDIESYKNHIVAGFNYPPSQYQLHLQFMMPPLMPYHYFLYLKGAHYTAGRFIPIEYARAVLKSCLSHPYPKKIFSDTPQEQIFDYFKTKGIDYYAIHSECYQRYGDSHRKLANYDRHDFEGVNMRERGNDKLWDLSSKPPQATNDTKTWIAADKLILQNYGRPYVNGKPTGTYYAHAKKKLNVHICMSEDFSSFQVTG